MSKNESQPQPRTNASRPVLGKGLASLLPGAAVSSAESSASADSAGSSAAASNHDRHPGIALALVDDIQVNNYQPRHDFEEAPLAELAASIQTNGIIQPLVVRKLPSGKYQLIAGERRLRAARRIGLKQVPVVIRRSTDKEALELALVENIQRQDLNCVEEAMAYHQLSEEFTLTQEEIAHRVGKDRATVANCLRLLKLPEAIQDDLKRRILSFGHAKVLLGLEDSDQQLLARARIVEKGMSVRETEAWVQELRSGNAAAQAAAASTASAPLSPVQERLHSVAGELTHRLSTRVEIKGTAKRGKILVHYANRQELDRLIEVLQTCRS